MTLTKHICERRLISCKISTKYLCVIHFLSRSFLAVTHFVILCSGYRFAEVIRSNCKEVADLRFVHPNAAQLTYFSQNPQIWNLCIYRWELCSLASCSLLSACFFFSLFLLCLPDMCASAIFRENQSRLCRVRYAAMCVPFNVSCLCNLGPSTLQKPWVKIAWVLATLHGWLKVLLF